MSEITKPIMLDETGKEVRDAIVALSSNLNGIKGKDGNDGVSCTHSWKGTTLTVTSASGTSSADLKGDKGDKGDPGNNHVTPEMFGAVGDGVADDTSAFIAALAASDNVYVPEGTYVISAPLDLTAGKSLFADEAHGAKLRYVGTSGNVVLLGRYSKFQNIDIHIPNVLSGSVFNTDNRLNGSGASFLYTLVSGVDVIIDQDCNDLTLINIVASNADGCNGFCYQTYRDINALAPDYVDTYAHSKWGKYSTGIKITLSADKANTAELSWITHLNFEDIFLGSPITAVKTGIVNNSGVASPTPISSIDQVMLTNVSSQISVGYSKKFYDIDWCKIHAINCIAWDYEQYIDKYNTFGGNAKVLLQDGEMPPVDKTLFSGETFATDSQYWDDFPYFINKYFSLLPTLTTGLQVSGRNDPRFATKITSVIEGANIDEISSADGGAKTPEVITPSIYRISGRINVGTAAAPIEKQGVGIQIGAGTYWGWNGTASKRIMFTTSGECYMSQYAGGSKTWSAWVKIFTQNNLDDIFDGITESVNGLIGNAIDSALDEAEESGRFSGDGYVLTDSDKAEIAGMVDNAVVVQSPKFVSSVEEMTDTNMVYVLTETGHLWANMETEIEQEVTVTDKIVGTADNPYQVGRLSSGGGVSTDVTTHVVTPFIDLTQAKYAGKTIQLHLDGNRYVTESNETYIMSALFKTDKTVLNGRSATCLDKNYGILTTIANMSAVINGEKSATLTITVPPSWSGTVIGYMRFCGLGSEEASNVYITYPDVQIVKGKQWTDTGLTYAYVAK